VRGLERAAHAGAVVAVVVVVLSGGVEWWMEAGAPAGAASSHASRHQPGSQLARQAGSALLDVRHASGELLISSDRVLLLREEDHCTAPVLSRTISTPDSDTCRGAARPCGVLCAVVPASYHQVRLRSTMLMMLWLGKGCSSSADTAGRSTCAL
jgi:hypothetical protein